MTSLNKGYQRLAQSVIAQAYRDGAKDWIKYNEWNFDIICGVAGADSKAVKERFLLLKETRKPARNEITRVAKELGVPYRTLFYQYRKFHDFDKAVEYVKNRGNVKKVRLADKKEEIIRLRNQGMEWQVIAEKLDIKQATMYWYRKKENLE